MVRDASDARNARFIGTAVKTPAGTKCSRSSTLRVSCKRGVDAHKLLYSHLFARGPLDVMSRARAITRAINGRFGKRERKAGDEI